MACRLGPYCGRSRHVLPGLGDMNNNLIAWLLVKLGRIIFYSGAYRYKKTGEKVPYKYSYHIEHVELTRKS